ncbi:MAG: hypothetical protein ACXIUZ_04535 [Lysobacteraceae bacterium]
MRLSPPVHALPLPSPATPFHRRHRVGARTIAADRFRHLLQVAETDIGQPIDVDEDRLATAARHLLLHGGPSRLPACISERLRCAAAMALMLQDAHWHADERAAGAARGVVRHVHGGQSLFENATPALRFLGDALLVDAAWPRTSAEVLSYCDYRRLRLIESELRGCDWREFGFTRSDYREAREAESALLAQRRRTGLGSYLQAPRFGSRTGIH